MASIPGGNSQYTHCPLYIPACALHGHCGSEGLVSCGSKSSVTDFSLKRNNVVLSSVTEFNHKRSTVALL